MLKISFILIIKYYFLKNLDLSSCITTVWGIEYRYDLKIIIDFDIYLYLILR